MGKLKVYYGWAKLVKFREKLERKKLECAECEKRLELLVERRRNNQ